MSTNVINTFLPRRRAQLYVEIKNKKGVVEAGTWIAQNVPKEERADMQPYVTKLLEQIK